MKIEDFHCQLHELLLHCRATVAKDIFVVKESKFSNLLRIAVFLTFYVNIVNYNMTKSF